jgi:integrase
LELLERLDPFSSKRLERFEPARISGWLERLELLERVNVFMHGWRKLIRMPYRGGGHDGNRQRKQTKNQALAVIDGGLLGHRDVSTTMIYTHVLNRGGRGVQSPADRLLKS